VRRCDVVIQHAEARDESSAVFLGSECRGTKVEVEVRLRPTVSLPVCLAVGIPSGAHDQIFVFLLTVADFLMWGGPL
jgi:hypothetical protein